MSCCCRYCNQVLDKDIDVVCTQLLQDLVHFHDRLFHKDPSKVIHSTPTCILLAHSLTYRHTPSTLSHPHIHPTHTLTYTHTPNTHPHTLTYTHTPSTHSHTLTYTQHTPSHTPNTHTHIHLTHSHMYIHT